MNKWINDFLAGSSSVFSLLWLQNSQNLGEWAVASLCSPHLWRHHSPFGMCSSAQTHSPSGAGRWCLCIPKWVLPSPCRAAWGKESLRVPRNSKKSIPPHAPKPLGSPKIQRDQVKHPLHGQRWEGGGGGTVCQSMVLQIIKLCFSSENTLHGGLNCVSPKIYSIPNPGACKCDFGNRVFSLHM